MKSVEEKVRNIVTPFLKSNNLYLYDLKFVKEGKNRYLRVFIDKIDNVNLKDCEKVAKFLNEELDKIDPIKENYFLEVTSPGIERVFKSENDYLKNINSKVKIKCIVAINSQYTLTGKLIEKRKDKIVLLDDTSKQKIDIELKNIKKIKNIIEF